MVPPKQDPVRNPLLIIQVVLIGMLFVALTLSAIFERGAPGSAPTADVNAIKTEAVLATWASATQTAEVWTPTLQFTPTAENAPTLSATVTPSPTSTAQYTPPLSTTDTPSSAATRPPEPILRTGTGDSLFYPEKWPGPAVVRITYDGSGFFSVWTLDKDGKRELQLANSLGAYHGDSLIDFLGNQRTLHFEVRTAGAWQIELLPLSSAHRESIPGVIAGTGDEVILLDGSQTPERLTVDASDAWGNFTVWAYGGASNLMINAVAPYTGTMPLPSVTTAIAVKAIGPWSLEIITR